MKTLITGGAGFIGSHLGKKLLDAGLDVVAVDDLSTGSLNNISGIIDHENYQFIRESVLNESLMTTVMAECDTVYHLAAAVGVQLIVDDPVRTIRTNIHGSEVVLDLASKFGCKLLLASTSEVYGKNNTIPFSEDDDTLLGPTTYTRWSYACSKMVDEHLALAYQEQFGLKVVICRFFNTIGARQTGQYGMVVPRFVDWAIRNEPIKVYGTGDQSRCFCNVADVVYAITNLMQCPEAIGKVINVGSDKPISMNDLAAKIIEMTGSTSQIERLSYEEAYGRPFDDMLVRAPNLARIKSLIDYEPANSLELTLQQIIDYEKTQL